MCNARVEAGVSRWRHSPDTPAYSSSVRKIAWRNCATYYSSRTFHSSTCCISSFVALRVFAFGETDSCVTVFLVLKETLSWNRSPKSWPIFGLVRRPNRFSPGKFCGNPGQSINICCEFYHHRSFTRFYLIFYALVGGEVLYGRGWGCFKGNFLCRP